jgi:subtilisin family serine protease
LLAGQAYLSAVKAFGFWPMPAPSFVPVRVAVIDSGIDGGQPDFQGRVAVSRSFVVGSPVTDEVGHGTMVAGEILAAAGDRPDGQGSAAPVQLVIGKVIAVGGTIDVDTEAQAIRWAADQGARVINLSFGVQRNPNDTSSEAYSAVEDAAVQYAYRKGAVVVAATGNCADICPYDFADYPAALPHVLAVSALAEDGTAAGFSNQDPRRNDIAAPGAGIVSTFPPALSTPGCAEPDYSICASDPDYRQGDGTSFAAPLVSAATALLFALRPSLTAGQAMSILEHTADAVAGQGHNPQTGYGRLDIANALRALARPLPTANSAAGIAASIGSFRLTTRREAVQATLDYYDDPLDIYTISLRRNQTVTIKITGEIADSVTADLITPTAKNVRLLDSRHLAKRIAARLDPLTTSLHYRARATGSYSLEIHATDGNSGSYRLLVNS